MTQAELYTALVSLSLPVAYREFKGTTENPAPKPPFICYQFTGSADLMADNQNYAEVSDFDIELYTDEKDLDSEKLIEDLLKTNHLPYSKTEEFIDSEKLLQVVYSIRVIGG